MLRLRVTSDCQPRTKKTQPPHQTTGVASSISSHWRRWGLIRASTLWGHNSALMALINTGMANMLLTQKRRVISRSSESSSSASTVRGSSAMPHLGQLPGWSWTISGCMGQVYSVLVVATGTLLGSSAMPHLGQLPGPTCSISGCMGQV